MDYEHQIKMATDPEQQLRAELTEEENTNLRETLHNLRSQSEQATEDLRQELQSNKLRTDSETLAVLKQLTQSKKETSTEAMHCRKLDRRAEQSEEENQELLSTIANMKLKHSIDHGSWQSELDTRPQRRTTHDASTCVRNVFGPTNKTSWGDLYEDDDHC